MVDRHGNAHWSLVTSLTAECTSIDGSKLLEWMEYLINESTEVQTLGAIRIQLYHQCFEQVWQHNFTSFIGLRRSTQRHRFRRSAHRSSIFESRHIDLRRSTHRSSKIEGGNILRGTSRPGPRPEPRPGPGLRLGNDQIGPWSNGTYIIIIIILYIYIIYIYIYIYIYIRRILHSSTVSVGLAQARPN